MIEVTEKAAKKRKLFIIALDGAADRKIAALGNRTPLEAARTPNLDTMVRSGQMSRITVLKNGLAPESDSGAMALLGYPPEQYYCGRGTLECMGLETYRRYRYFAGFRINFAAVDYLNGTLDRRTGRGLSAQELQALTQEICNGVRLDNWDDISFELKTFGGFRGILGLYSNKTPLSGAVSNTDPGFVKQGNFSIPVNDYEPVPMSCVPLAETPAAVTTAAIVNAFVKQCEQILRDSQVSIRRKQRGQIQPNCILVRDGGILPVSMPRFRDKYGAELAIYGQLPCEKAMADMMGGVFHYSQAFELQLDEAYLKKLAQTVMQEPADVIFCHLKGPDEPGHDNRPFDKVRAIELIDRSFFQELWEPGTENLYVVSCDHATPCDMGIHSSDKVPLLITGGGIIPDGTIHFDEENASRGTCPVDCSTDILNYLFAENTYD